jgi:flagellum-specific peptidoglycan hydrolase FlgJ
VLEYIISSLHRFLSSFLGALIALTAIVAGLYQYQNNWDEISNLPVIREITNTYLEFSSPLSLQAFSQFYEVKEGAVQFYDRNRTTTSEGQLVVRSTWNKDSIIQKLQFSRSKRKQARHYVRYIEQYKQLALRDMYLYKVPASIKLAQGLLESNAGRSKLSEGSKNHFGIKARAGKEARAKIKARQYSDLQDNEFIPVSPAIGTMQFTDDHTYDRFEVYHTVGDSYKRHTQLLTRPCSSARKGCYSWIWKEFTVGQSHSIAAAAQRFFPASGIKAEDFFGGKTNVPYYVACAAGLKMAGYATSPTYHKKLTYIIETYELWRFDIDLLRAVERSLVTH